MEDRRKHNRIPFKVSLVVDSLFKQNNTKIENLDAEITVYDISPRGVGFYSKADLPIDFYFDAEISFDGFPCDFNPSISNFSSSLRFFSFLSLGFLASASRVKNFSSSEMALRLSFPLAFLL